MDRLSHSFSSESGETEDETADIEKVQSKKIMLLQFQPEFEGLIMVGIFLGYVMTLLDLSFAFSTNIENIPSEYKGTGMALIYCVDIVYLVDILLMIAYKKSDYDEIKHIYPERSSFLLGLDIISVTPLDAAYFSLASANMRVLYVMRLRYMLRVFRFIKKYREWRNNVRYNHVFVEIIGCLVVLITYLITATCIVNYIFCSLNERKYADYRTYLLSMYYISTYLSYGQRVEYEYIYEIIYFITTIFYFIAIKGLGIGLLSIAFAYHFKNKFVFDSYETIVTILLRKYGIKDELYYTTVQQYFELMWKHRKGLPQDEFNCEILPEIMTKELKLDIYWDCLKHSHLFRDADVSFLRYVSSFIVFKTTLPGEVIFKRGEYKSAMIYVSNGTIQILSEQDGESPIISFSRGTCIGETSLIVNYHSTCTVMCQHYCELCLLYRKDFMEIIKHYPDECRSIFCQVRNRYIDTKDTEQFLNKTFNDENNYREVLSLKWLKIILKELMSNKKNEEPKIMNFEERRTLALIDANLYCTTYLDMLAISDQNVLLTDSVFMKTSCPCILQPDSFVLKTWNNVVNIVLMIFLVVYPYYAAFQPVTSTWYFVLSYVVTVIWALDIYVNLSTAIKTKHKIITEFSEITLIKGTDVSFLIDVAAVLPVELLFILIIGKVNTQTMVLLQFTRLFKVYRIFYLFDTMEKEKRTYVIFLMNSFLLSYYFGAFLHLGICFNGKCLANNMFYNFVKSFAGDDPVKITFMWFYLLMTQMCRLFVSIETEGDMDPLYVQMTAINIINFMFFVYHLAKISAIVALKNYNQIKIQEHFTNLKKSLIEFNLKPEMKNKVMRHIEGQLQFNGGLFVLFPPLRVRQLFHAEIVREVKIITLQNLLKEQRVFAGLPDEIINEITQQVNPSLIVPGEVITYSGEMCYKMYIIRNGFCAVITAGKVAKILKPGDSLSAIEMCFQIPVVNTVVTLTHCHVSVIDYDHFMHCIHLNPEVFKSLNAAIVNVKNTVNMDIYDTSTLETDSVKIKNEKISSFKTFGYKLDYDSKEGLDYFEYFNEHHYCTILKYILMRFTIHPYGPFLMYWEISRCIFAYLTTFLVPMTFYSSCSNCPWKYLFNFLDFMAWLDIYLRHHVGYFNDMGIEITHPAKTAAYYWKHALFIDLLGVLPFEHVAPIFGVTSTNRIIFFKCTRCLQIYRFFGGLRVLGQFVMVSNMYRLFKYLPVAFLVFGVVGSLNANISCQFDPSIKAQGIYADGVCCDSKTLELSTYAKPISPERVTLYYMLITAEIIFTPIIGVCVTRSIFDATIIMCQALFGYVWFMWVFANILSMSVFRHTHLTSYQKSMASLIKFLSYRRIDPKLKEEVIEHYEYIWQKSQSRNFHKMIDCTFSQALREDMLYDVYGKGLSNNIFPNATGAFFRSILLNVNHQIFLKRGIICQVNNIISDIFIIYKGHVDVLGPDYNRLLVLPRGSMFGNIDDCPMSRQTLTMVAKGHVELLTISSITFHKILSKYPHLKESFFNLIVLNTDYLSSALNLVDDSIFIKKDTTTTTTGTSASTKSLSYTLSSFLQPRIELLLNSWEIVILVFVYYIGTTVQLYQVSVDDCQVWLVALLYFIDLLYVINIIINFNTPFQNEFGIFVTDKKLIARAYMRNPLKFPLQLASTFPLELFCLLYLNTDVVCKLWTYCRTNRFLRIFYLLQYFQKKSSQLNINVMVMHSLEIIIWTSLLAQFITLLSIVLDCVNPQFNLTPLIQCDWTQTNSSYKFYVYFKQLVTIANIAFGLHVTYYVANAIRLILFFMILIVWSKLIIAAILSQITATADSTLNDRYVYEQEVRLLHERMVGEGTSPALLNRIWDYACLLWEKNDGIQYPAFLKTAPYYLREAVMNSMFGFHLRKHPVFSTCHVDLLRQISAQMVTRIFFSGDHVAFVNDIDECMYFIHEGAVSALSEDELTYEKVEYSYIKGEMFGLRQGILKKKCHEYTYKAENYTVLIVLERSKWIHLLDFFPASREVIYSKVKTM